ncbi:hypothetical protein [Rhizobium phaseoli]|uniref:hypothetical protein n=1 Tax=Rhizobium phaseoli TaxID=396 RepID=UPI0014386457|nr:hypothetical protein [Rhizobium phaseoli]MDK4725461.1 hypothetical protein [Rhizobium phaseoli]NKE89325.1 hypothetical protein [Rhizobium phaseoli]
MSIVNRLIELLPELKTYISTYVGMWPPHNVSEPIQQQHSLSLHSSRIASVGEPSIFKWLQFKGIEPETARRKYLCVWRPVFFPFFGTRPLPVDPLCDLLGPEREHHGNKPHFGFRQPASLSFKFGAEPTFSILGWIFVCALSRPLNQPEMISSQIALVDPRKTQRGLAVDREEPVCAVV